MFTEQLKESVSIAATLLSGNGTSQAAGTYVTGAIDMSKFARAMFIVGVSTLGGSATITSKLQESANSDGSSPSDFATAVTGTTLSAANTLTTLEVRADQMTKRYLLCSVTIVTAASIVYAIPLAFNPRFHPQSSDVAAVQTRVVAA